MNQVIATFARTKADEADSARLTAGSTWSNPNPDGTLVPDVKVGVICGRDLRWDPARPDWLGETSHSHDSIVKRLGDRFTELVKRTYPVLLTRGFNGCYVYFEDRTTQSRFASQALPSGRSSGA